MAMIQRRKTVTAVVGGVRVGSDAPVVVQSMTNTDTADIPGTVQQVAALARSGSELVRVTVNNDEAAAAVPRIVEELDKQGVRVPIIGDFHYNGHVLLTKYPECARDLAKYRINPGNASIGRGGDSNFRTMVEVAVKYLADERWYVVRNMCGVLAELSDPHLVEHIAPALRHSDARVQQAALKAMMKARGARTAGALAEALPSLSPQVLDEALAELTYTKSPHTIAALEAFVASGGSNLVRANKAIQALGAIADVSALYALGRLFRIEELDSKIRRAALAAIAHHRSAIATRLLEELSTSWGPLAEEVRKELDKRTLKED